MSTANAQNFPQAEITNGLVHAKLYLPDAKTGYYRGTRFDWSGVISSLTFGGHDYYGPWFTKQDPAVRDFIYKDDDIVVSSESGSMGPADEFQTPLGFDAAQPGALFIKVGVGVLRRPDAVAYSPYNKYELVDPGKWTYTKSPDAIQFTQQLTGPGGFAYVYTKTVRLAKGKPEMEIRHTLRNSGSKAIATSLYNHNFLTLDQAGTRSGYVIQFPFDVRTTQPPNKALSEVNGRQIAYLKTLQNRDTVAMPLEGFSADAKDYDIRVENKTIGAGVRVVGDHPMASLSLWSIRSVLAIEPFVAISVEPGNEMSWSYAYTYYVVK